MGSSSGLIQRISPTLPDPDVEAVAEDPALLFSIVSDSRPGAAAGITRGAVGMPTIEGTAANPTVAVATTRCVAVRLRFDRPTGVPGAHLRVRARAAKDGAAVSHRPARELGVAGRELGDWNRGIDRIGEHVLVDREANETGALATPIEAYLAVQAREPDTDQRAAFP